MGELQLIQNRVHKETGSHIKSLFRHPTAEFWVIEYQDGRRDQVDCGDTKALVAYLNEHTREPKR